MFQNYFKRFSIKSFNGNSFQRLTSFEQVFIGDEAVYYLIDQTLNLILVFNDKWNYLNSSVLPFNGSYCVKYFASTGHFYFSSTSYFYETDLNLNVLNFNYAENYLFRQLTIINSLIWTVAWGVSVIYGFDTKNISHPVFWIPTHNDFSNGFSSPINNNGLGFIGGTVPIVYIFDTTTSLINMTYKINECSGGEIRNIAFDLSGNMALTCSINYKIVLYNYTGQSLNLQIPTSGAPTATAIDSKGRYIILDSFIEIYY